MLDHHQAMEIFKRAGALMEGHFLLTSGRHSNQYMQCAQVLQYPQETELLARHLAEAFKDDQVGLVVGPAMGGIIVAYEVARQLGVPGIFTERQDGQMCLRRGFVIKPGQRVLVVEDVITTGGSVLETIKVVEKYQGIVKGVAVLVDRSNGQVDLGYPLYSLLSLEVQSYTPKTCPLCQKGIPLVKPGSRLEG